MQCVWRGYVVRKNFGRFLAARVVQAAWRGFWGRKQFELAVLRAQDPVAVARDTWRGAAFRAHYAAGNRAEGVGAGSRSGSAGLLLYEIQQRTAVKIQAHYRGYLTQAGAAARRCRRRRCIRIQRGWRRIAGAPPGAGGEEGARWSGSAAGERQRRRGSRRRTARQAARAYAAGGAAQGARGAGQTWRRARSSASRGGRRAASGCGGSGRRRIAVERELATIHIQRVQRGPGGADESTSASEREQAATMIQAAARRKEARKVVAAIKAAEADASTTPRSSIQCFWRRKQAERALERRRAAHRLEKRRSAALKIQTKWRGRIARKWLHRERKRWKKADRSLHAEIYDSWFDHADRFHFGHEDMEARWPYEQSEEWRGNIHAAYLAGKELRNKRYALLQQHFATDHYRGGESRGSRPAGSKAGRKPSRHASSRGQVSTAHSTSMMSSATSQKTSMGGSAAVPRDSADYGKSKQTQRVYGSVQGILRTLVQRGIFEETGLPVDTVGLRKISKGGGGGGKSVGNSMSDYQLRIATTRSSQPNGLPYQLEGMDPNLPAAAGSGLRGVRAAQQAASSRKQQAWPDGSDGSIQPPSHPVIT